MTGSGHLLADRLSAFSADWRRARQTPTLAERLGSLLPRLHQVLPPPAMPNSPVAIATERLETVLSALSKVLGNARSAGAMINPWTVAGLKRREVRNAAVLAALWSPAQGGVTALRFLTEFLRRVDARDQSLPTAEDLVQGYTVRAECSPEGDLRDRVDLVLEGPRHIVGIEVKIGAGEGADQLDRYARSINNVAQGRDKAAVLIFLAPFAPSRADVLHANWSTVRSAAFAAVPSKRSDWTFMDHLVSSFGRHVATF